VGFRREEMEVAIMKYGKKAELVQHLTKQNKKNKNKSLMNIRNKSIKYERNSHRFIIERAMDS
jgi:hypothetical protein